MDNYFKICPPTMSDGRFLADHKSSTRRDEYIKNINGITRDDQYRHFLQTNGTKIMDNVWNYHDQHDSCNITPCVHTFPTRQVPADFVKEKELHDLVAKNGYAPFKGQPKCPKHEDYRMTYTQPDAQSEPATLERSAKVPKE